MSGSIIMPPGRGAEIAVMRGHRVGGFLVLAQRYQAASAGCLLGVDGEYVR
jgi:hypothetical protein